MYRFILCSFCAHLSHNMCFGFRQYDDCAGQSVYSKITDPLTVFHCVDVATRWRISGHVSGHLVGHVTCHTSSLSIRSILPSSADSRTLLIIYQYHSCARAAQWIYRYTVGTRPHYHEWTLGFVLYWLSDFINHIFHCGLKRLCRSRIFCDFSN